MSVTPPEPSGWRDLGALAGAAGLCVLLMFLLWQGIQSRYAGDDVLVHRLHFARGVSTALAAAVVVGAIAWRQRRRRAAELQSEVTRRTREADEARALLEVIVDNVPASLVVVDRDWRVVQANRTAERVHGAALVGRPCFETLMGRAERCPECPAADSWEHHRARSFSGPHTDPRTGEVLAVESHPLPLPGGREYVLLVERVITEQQKLQARLVHQEKMAAFGLLAAGVAHDLGNPLSSVEAQIQLLDDRSLPEEAAGVLATVRHELGRLRRLLRELVDFARRRRDEASLVSVQEVVGDALRLLKHDRRLERVRVTTEFDPDSPPVSVVEDHLMQVVLNLMLNAVDAMPHGGALRVEVRPAGDRVVLRVHDDGIGMDHKVLERAFEPLFTTKSPGQGTGLGLSISRDILAACGGTIELHSAPGRGTSAVITLPAAALDADTGQASAGPRVATTPAGAEPHSDDRRV